MKTRLPEAVRERVEAIRKNRTSGAAELAVLAAETLILLSERPGFSPLSLGQAARALIAAQPTMAPIFNLANRVLFHRPEEVAEACRDFLRRLETARRAVAALAAARLQDGMTVLTHSYSSTVLDALLLARMAGRRFQVVSTESRPLCEGVTLAKRLAQQDIPVKLIVDAAVLSFLPATQLVLVGADAISPRGLVNKSGTALVALAAHNLHVPIYALCSSQKFLPARYPASSEPPKDPSEILGELVPNLTPVNYYFDSTPLEHFTGILTEAGILKPGGLKRHLRTLRIHPSLRVDS
jgi:translation initiation factor 2B subunit (eIF-2B alpha/beta/delta family)